LVELLRNEGTIVLCSGGTACAQAFNSCEPRALARIIHGQLSFRCNVLLRWTLRKVVRNQTAFPNPKRERGIFIAGPSLTLRVVNNSA